jgi:hypothetical protein
MNLTDWFPGSVKPVRKGVYQREYIYGKAKFTYFCYWDGKQWYGGASSANGAVKEFLILFVAPNQFLPWRGVLK